MTKHERHNIDIICECGSQASHRDPSSKEYFCEDCFYNEYNRRLHEWAEDNVSISTLDLQHLDELTTEELRDISEEQGEW